MVYPAAFAKLNKNENFSVDTSALFEGDRWFGIENVREKEKGRTCSKANTAVRTHIYGAYKVSYCCAANITFMSKTCCGISCELEVIVS